MHELLADHTAHSLSVSGEKYPSKFTTFPFFFFGSSNE